MTKIFDEETRIIGTPVFTLEEGSKVEDQLVIVRRILEGISLTGEGIGELAEIVKEINGKMADSSSSSTSDDPTVSYKITDLDTTAATQYFGYTNASGNWYIMQLTSSAARYIKGDGGYSSSWTNRATLTYQYFNLVF